MTDPSDRDHLTFTVGEVKEFNGTYSGCGSHHVDLTVTMCRRDAQELYKTLGDLLGKGHKQTEKTELVPEDYDPEYDDV